MKMLLMLLLLVCACDKPTCNESACKPAWTGDCACYNGAKMEYQADGTVLCKCPVKQ